ncbi:MAG: MotA/TolQ/ExbB proton channel family protein [Flavobacteriales bacterium]|nr:MotA/TolQ/ExbB proton channel family protein [Flavobacteriales bacterium]
MKTPLLLQINAAATEADTLAQDAVTEETISIWELIAGGGWYIMGPLAILSILAVYIFAERWMAIKRASKQDKDFMNRIKDYVSEGKLDAARSLCLSENTPVSRMIDKGVNRIGKPATFHAMKISGNGVEIEALSGGIMQAMITTVAGLIIGIVAYMAYNILVVKVDKVVHGMERQSIEFIDLLEQPGN